MPKVKCSKRVKLNGFVQSFGEKYFSTDGDILFCKICEVKVSAEKRFAVQQHCNTAKHKESLQSLSSKENRQLLLFETYSTAQESRKTSEFSKDLLKMMISANIPLNKVRNKHFKSFLEKYTSEHVPHESTLRRNYLTSCYEEVLRGIRCRVENNKIWVSIDETTDVDGRYVANVVIGTLKPDSPGETFLLTSEILQKANNSTIAILFDNAMKLLSPEGVDRDSVILFLTDAAPYMVKAAKGLKLLYPKMLHLTCLSHGLHRVSEEIRSNYHDVDRLIANVKKIFVKAPLRVQKFKEENPELPLPPQPVITRWGTWLNAANYYCENYTAIKDFISGLNSDDASSIAVAKELFCDSLSANLAYIKSNFSNISTTITRLEAVGLPLHDALDLVKNVVFEIGEARGEAAEKVKLKLQNILRNNIGYSTICKISEVLDGVECTMKENEPALDCNDFTFFKYAPVTSCDVERSFSRYKNILSDNRRSFKFQQLQMHVVICCNSGN